MAKKTEKRVTKISPIGEAKWAHVQEPKAPFAGDSNKGAQYMIDVVFSLDDPAWAGWLADLKKVVTALPQQTNPDTGEKIPHQSLLHKEKNEAGEPTGRFYFTSKTSAKYKPGLFDAKRNPLPDGTLIGNGSKVRVAYTENVYEAFGGGVNLYLEGVQVLKLVEFQRRSAAALGFVEEAGESIVQDSDSAPF